MKLKTKKTLSVPGFVAGGMACGIKKNGKPDLALIVSETPATAAGLFTTNQVVSPTVTVTRQHLQAAKSVRAIVANSGNANACTGPSGDRACRDMVVLTAKQLGVTERDVLVASTGVIGVPFPLAPVEKGLPQLAGNLVANGWDDAARAILTTDLVIKTACVEYGGVTVGGITKGSGMIHPNMATMLAFVGTNLKIGKADLKAALKVANEYTFNRINVDGDTSTNDMILVLANGQAGNAPVKKGTQAFKEFVAALTEVCRSLAFQIVKDGEGATKFVTVGVKGAKTEKQALRVSRAVADSKLVQTALFGEDPNWGRIIAAVGYAGVPLKPEKIDIAFNGTPLVKNGAPVAGLSVAALHKQMKAKDLRIDIGLNLGRASAETYTCDLSYDYVRINAEYTT
ncbi:bifunctional glutamate N-acetyltransferase/amino-acid acetyltransferase ArgJ [Nitrospina watsonii]|uniref:Arginine biosynthesis bifunctional protein ArgJ n=1 Tax=Nitrospina watsonii TaxID=1323948 RepID=A0ABM9HHP2_9BACT|nr:bifunctional glutamate N-acetyltransferase/amino-acid acetyltransferase ArgJ [Nitrospina watsonii]CAI2719682.1 Glutamate N-acetyltransferase / Amino-acid acetyltransferase [Nitrospina watsonii]